MTASVQEASCLPCRVRYRCSISLLVGHPWPTCRGCGCDFVFDKVDVSPDAPPFLPTDVGDFGQEREEP